MSSNLFSTTLRGSMACTLAAFGLCLAAPAQAQPDEGYYGDGNSASVGDVVVVAPHHYERSTATGATIETISTSRVVDASDLDLSNPDDMGILRDRVERAANSACNQLDDAWTMGLVPTADESSTDCVARAVHRAMRHVELEYSANY
jgi:UrcA family protein